MNTSLISIPEYFSRFVDRSVNLNQTPKICCPFHQEDTPSFSYSAEKGVWRCFGACKTGGDVVALHQHNYRLHSRDKAEESLCKLLGLPREKHRKQITKGTVDESAVTFKAAYAKALMVTQTPGDWDELDEIMGQYPQEVHKLDAYYICRRPNVRR